MDKDFEKKVKQKRIRTIAVAVVIIAAVIYLIAGTKVEKADYTDSLNKEIKAAQNLYAECKGNVGNGEGQYAAYTILKFEKDIAKAEAVAADEASEYNDKKMAYETLQTQVKVFEKDTNALVLTAEEMQSLIAQKETKEVKTEIKDGKELIYTISGDVLDEALTMNLMAREEGPYYDEIISTLAEKKLQGQVLSFYQDGTFGGKIQVLAPIYSEKETTGYVYKVNPKTGKMAFVSKAKIDLDAQTAVFTAEEGGDYVVLTEKIHQTKKPVKEVVEEEMEENSPDEVATEEPEEVPEPESSQDEAVEEESDEVDTDTTETSETDSETGDENEEQESDSDEDTVEDTPAMEPETSENIKVNIDIRCDTLAADLSKLRDPALEAYVPADGWILSLTDVEVEKGASVYDVLDMVCRNKGIHLEAVYTPSYGADYIEGINYLYEFDAGEQSGWMFMVNGVFPNYGCSDYILEDGDSIVWAYTCDMGKDLGKQ